MNITLRPSGGRGEYELAGQQGSLHVSDLFDLPIFIEILPSSAISAYSKCRQRDGKPRIRLTHQRQNAHPSALIAAAMMLPKPRRERHETHGENLLRWEQFVVQTIRIDVTKRTNSVLVCPVTVRLENGDGSRLDISFAERMARVVRVWAVAATGSNALAEAVRGHASAFANPLSTQAALVAALPTLHEALDHPSGDLLPLLEAHFGLTASTAAIGSISADVGDETFAEDVHMDPVEARVERVRQWRLAAIRGGSSATFRRQVNEAYDSRCMFSGARLPRTEATPTAGVDAAHILPWSRFDLDSPINGICLSKQCHWAYDAGVLRLSFDSAANTYLLSIPDLIRVAANKVKFDLHLFQPLVGPVPLSRLPNDKKLWPSQKYIDALNEFLDDNAA